MSTIFAETTLRTLAFASTNPDKPLYFDLSDPKIIIGLMLGAFTPYLMPVIPAAITKWVILRLILPKEARPTVGRLVAVAMLEITYVLSLAVTAGLVGMDRIYGFPMPLAPIFVCGGLGLLCNLLLLPGRNQLGGAAYSLWMRAFLAFGLGLTYWGYLVLIAVLLQLALHGVSG
jgi:hypothetical protein